MSKSNTIRQLITTYIRLRQQNCSIVTSACKACVAFNHLQLGRAIHADSIKLGFNTNAFVGSSLISLYSSLGSIHYAHKVFDEITHPDIVAYTSIITAYARVAHFRAYEAFSITTRMQQREGMHPNRVTLVSLLQVASHLDTLRQGRAVHGYAVRRGIGFLDQIFETSLVDMYNKCGALGMSACIFGRMKRKTIGLWNVMIAGYLRSEQPVEGFRTFCHAMREKYVPDMITYSNGISCCAQLGYLTEGKSIHGRLVRACVELDVVATTSLVDFYSKCHKLIQARTLFDRMEGKDAIFYDVMMNGYLHNQFASDATHVFLDMVKEGIQPNVGSILCVLSASLELSDFRSGKCIHGYVLRRGLISNIEISNQMIYLYSKFGWIVCARNIFDKTRHRDLISWTSMMMGYVHHGHADEAIILFRLMQKKQVENDTPALSSLLQALSLLGCLNLVKEVHCHLYRINLDSEISLTNTLITTYSRCGKLYMASNLFDHVVKRCLTSWNAMIHAYGMHGKCSEALMVYEQMKINKVKPDGITFTSILTSCSHSGMVNEGLQVFKSMVEEFSVIPSEEHYGCMVDLLSRAGLLEEAYNLIKSLPSRLGDSTLGTLVAACKLHGNTEMGEDIGRCLLDLEPKNSSAFAMVSSLYAESGKWGEVVRIRAREKGRGLRRTPGYSLIEAD